MLQLASVVFILWNCAFCKAETLDEPFNRNDRSNGILKDLYDILVEQKVQMIALRKNATDVSTKLETYKSQMYKQNDMISKLKTKNKGQKQDLQALKKQMKAEIQTIRREMDQFKQKRRSIAFMARIIPGIGVGGNTILPFNRVYINEGGGYRIGDGKFHCPRNGLYLFSLSVETKNSRLGVTLLKNGKEHGHLIKGTNGDTWGTGSVSTVIRLKYGDAVWAKCHQGATIGSITFFSGVQISD